MAEQTIDYGGDGGDVNDIDPATGKPRRQPLPSGAPIERAQMPTAAGSQMANLAPQTETIDYGGGTGGNGVMPGEQNPQTPSQTPATTPTYNTNGYQQPGYVAGNTYGAPAGYDAAKWADTAHQSPKYAVAKIMQEASGGTGNLADPAKRQVAIDNVIKAYPGATFDGKDKITMPDGGVVDVFGGAGAGQYSITWQPVTGPGGQPLPQEGGGPQIERGQGPPLQTTPGMPGAGAPGAPGAGTPGGTGTGGPGGAQSEAWKKLYDELVARSQQGLDVDPNDPIIKRQVDAAAAVANREALKQQQAAAERGGPYATGATQNAQRMSNEAVQLQQGAMQAELMSREVTARRQEIAQAFQQRQGMMTVEESSRLREIDQQLAREQMALADKHQSFQDALNQQVANENFGQMAWQRAFQDRGWESDLAQTNFQNERSLYY